MVQCISAFASIAVLSARTWVLVPPLTGGVFFLVIRFFSKLNPNAKICAMCLNKLAIEALHYAHKYKKPSIR